DATVGKVLAALDKADLADKTLVIYTSDNGSFMYRQESGDDHVTDNTIQAYSPGNHTANGELRGTKADIWEAGHRVPFFARWPTKIQAGTVTDTTICLTDFFATAAELIGADIPEGAAPDSYSFSHLMLGQEMHRFRPPVIHHSVAGMFAIRRGAWKLVLGNGSGGRQLPRGKAFAKPYQLFDLSQDLAEQNNLIESQAEIAAELEAAFEKIR
ncbi:MAG: sulfatase-like hydrolase/transferase, partial [Planctomycetota bacterium]|nr:sulfatase-like hydrolase/transferase [Planctomycetota bacterium]